MGFLSPFMWSKVEYCGEKWLLIYYQLLVIIIYRYIHVIEPYPQMRRNVVDNLWITSTYANFPRFVNMSRKWHIWPILSIFQGIKNALVNEKFGPYFDRYRSHYVRFYIHLFKFYIHLIRFRSKFQGFFICVVKAKCCPQFEKRKRDKLDITVQLSQLLLFKSMAT